MGTPDHVDLCFEPVRVWKTQHGMRYNPFIRKEEQVTHALRRLSDEERSKMNALVEMRSSIGAQDTAAKVRLSDGGEAFVYMDNMSADRMSVQAIWASSQLTKFLFEMLQSASWALTTTSLFYRQKPAPGIVASKALQAPALAGVLSKCFVCADEDQLEQLLRSTFEDWETIVL